MNELLIFTINKNEDIEIYYKDRDMKDFINVSTISRDNITKYKEKRTYLM